MKLKNRFNIHCCDRSAKLISLFFAVLIFFVGFPGVSGYYAHAEQDSGAKYTDVMTDLSKDPKFNPSEYAANDNDYSINVIQIAESSAKELFIYTYQPSGNVHDLHADYISISTSVNSNNPQWHLYSLTFVSCSGLFYKYVVDELTVASQLSRVYNISEILRPWNYVYDGESDSDNDIVSVPYEVAQEWAAVTVNGDVVYAFTKTQTIAITELWCGTLSFPDGVGLSTDGHFVAFDTDLDIDKLLSATVYFKSRVLHVGSVWSGFKKTWSEPTDHRLSLHYIDKGSNLGEGWMAPTYVWDRIISVSDFKADNSSYLTGDTKDQLVGKKWVLRYYETERTDGANFVDLAFTGYDSHTEITDFTILSLKFDMGGKVYNLGAVSNIQSPDDILDGGSGSQAPFWERVWRWLERNWKWFLIGFVAVLAIILLAPFMPTILSGLLHLFVLLFRGIVWLITLPAKGIAALIRKIRGANE